MILNIYKPQGLTPVQLIERLRTELTEYKDLKIGFAGRLDPLAHGVMLLTIGEENKNRQQYLSLNKTYQFSVLFGVKTDSYDYLGIPETTEIKPTPEDLKAKISKFIDQNVGKFSQPYPPFSSKTIKGIQMYKLAKEGQLKGREIPKRDVEIFDFKLLSIEEKSLAEVRKIVLRNLRKVTGHFRQTETVNKWKGIFSLFPDHVFTLANFEVECSSGTYVRSLASRMGQEFKCGAIAFEIFRTKVGDFEIKNALKLKT